MQGSNLTLILRCLHKFASLCGLLRFSIFRVLIFYASFIPDLHEICMKAYVGSPEVNEGAAALGQTWMSPLAVLGPGSQFVIVWKSPRPV